MPDTRERFYMFRRFYHITGSAILGDGNTWRYKIYAFIARFAIYSNWCGMVVDAIMHFNDLGHTIENISVIFALLCGLWIDTFFRIRKKAIEELLYSTEQFTWDELPLWNEVTGRLTMAGIISKIQRFLFHLRWITVFPHSTYMLYRTLMSRDLIGYNAWFPFDTRSSPVHELVTFAQMYCSYLYTSNFYGTLGLYATLVGIACTQLTKIHNTLMNLTAEDLTIKKGSLNNDLRDCIELHQRVMKYMEQMQDTLNLLLFGHFLIIMSGIAFGCFGFVMSWGNPLLVYQVCVVFTGQMLLLGAYCIFGSELSHQAQYVKFAAYSTGWIGSPISEQRSLLFMMAANKEFELAAGGFIPATKETMLAVLNQAFSFTMFLLNFKDEEGGVSAKGTK